MLDLRHDGPRHNRVSTNVSAPHGTPAASCPLATTNEEKHPLVEFNSHIVERRLPSGRTDLVELIDE